MADSQTFWAADFWATGFWADDFWAGGVAPPPVVNEPAGGGRRIKKREYRPLNKRERAELDRLFQRNVQPRYVAPTEPARVAKRTTPVVVAPIPVAAPPVTKPAERVRAAKQFLALDALESFLDRLEQDAPLEHARVAHIRAQQNAQRLAEEQERMALAVLAQREADRLEVIRQAELAEAKRIQDADDLLAVLLLVHDGLVT